MGEQWAVLCELMSLCWYAGMLVCIKLSTFYGPTLVGNIFWTELYTAEIALQQLKIKLFFEDETPVIHGNPGWMAD